MSPDDPRHGSVAGYVALCRDECCRSAWRINQRRARTRTYIARSPLTIDGTGTRRRMQALVALGWSLNDLDRELGRKQTYCSYLIRRIRPVLLATAEEVSALYDRLSMTRPEGWIADRQRRMAGERGWAPPLSWNNIDDPNEQPYVGRDHHVYLSAELAAEWDHFRRSGESIEQAARQLGVSVGAIEKACERVAKGSAA